MVRMTDVALSRGGQHRHRLAGAQRRPAGSGRHQGAGGGRDRRPRIPAQPVGPRGLRTRRTHTLSLVLPDITNPFFAELARATEMVCVDRGYGLGLSNSMECERRETSALMAATDRQCDGILLVPTTGTRTLPASRELPVVVFDRSLEGFSGVVSDNRHGARSAAGYLTAIGHELVAHIAGPPGVPAADVRRGGYLDVVAPLLEQRGLPAADYVCQGPFTYEQPV